ncbi:MAG TPA: hypothetical protein PJ991_03440, partial [Kiritimatiellia bacterium]|nr:hypothetical protein [Kiritimatiellia bacterium]
LINKRVTDLREYELPLSYRMGMPERANPYERFNHLVEARRPYNDTWIMFSFSVGAVIIVATLVLLHAAHISQLAKLGVFFFVTCSPPMLNMFGHFDSYWLSVLWVFAWGWAIVDTKMRLSVKSVAMAMIALLGYWTHPILLLLVPFTMLYVLVSVLRSRLGNGTLSLVAGAASVIIGLSPVLHPYARAPELHLQSPQMLTLFVAERSLQVFSTALPALYLGILSIVCGRHCFTNQASSARLVAGTAFFGTIIAYFTMNFTLGPLDFLNMSVLGAILLVSALILWRTGIAHAEPIICAGLLSAFVFFPQAYTYSRETIVDHFALLQPQSVCGVNRAYSPYIVLALRCPVELETDKDRFLRILRTGFEHPRDRWRVFGVLNRHYYTAWCYEFGRDALGRASLEWLFENATPSLPALWFDGARLTGRFENQAAKKLRADSRELIGARLENEPNNPELLGMLAVIRKCETGDWTQDELNRWSDRVEVK